MVGPLAVTPALGNRGRVLGQGQVVGFGHDGSICIR
jgi:hypothetical protein